MKTVLVINQFALPRTEGGATRHIDLFGRLPDWETVIIAGDRNHYTQRRFVTDDPHFRLLRVPVQDGRAMSRLLGWVVFAVQSFAAVARAREVDVVLGSSPQPFAALAGLVAARLRRRPFVLEVRDLWPASMVAAGHLRAGSPTHRLFAALEKTLARGAARIVCVTEGWESHFADLGVAPHRLVVVPNGTESSDFAVTQSRDDLRARHRISGFTAVFAGAHGPKDGIDLILDSAEQLPQIRFVLVGSGPSKPAAIRRAGQRELHNVEFREPVPKSDLAALLRACDVGIHAVTPLAVFDKGMSPNKLFDYMAAELPIVSNAETGLRKVLRQDQCGVVGPPDSLASSLRRVHEASPEQRRRWSEESLRLVRRRYSRADAARLLSSALSDVTHDRGRGPTP